MQCSTRYCERHVQGEQYRCTHCARMLSYLKSKTEDELDEYEHDAMVGLERVKVVRERKERRRRRAA